MVHFFAGKRGLGSRNLSIVHVVLQEADTWNRGSSGSAASSLLLGSAQRFSNLSGHAHWTNSTVGGGHSGVGGTFFHGRVRREKRQSTQTIMRFCFHLKLTVLIWNPSIVENFQDLELKPLASFMQVEFNKPNSLPMDTWLLPNRGDDPSVYEERMRLLGNIVVPACASLASEILLRVHRSWRATLSS